MMRDTRNPSLSGGDGSKPSSTGLAEGAWSQSLPAWSAQNTSRLWLGAGAGLGVLACLALGAAALKAFLPAGNDATCSTGSDCNERGVALAQAPDALALAARLFQRGCDQGHAAACNNLGLAYQSGRGVAENFEQARTAFQRACSEGFAEGCSNEGVLHEQGLGVPKNLGDAQRLYLQACQHGSALGCSNLGALYAEGRGVEADSGQAARFFAEACSRGSDVGCRNLFQSEHEAPKAAISPE
jgi:hypothetical protein